MRLVMFLQLILYSLCGFATDSQKPDLLLATVYKSGINVQRYWISEKLDGVRAYWDGEKLISRQGNVFNAPAWFTKGFPQQPLDGELWLARDSFEQTLSIIKSNNKQDQWALLTYQLFELPKAKGGFTERLQQLEILVAQTTNPYLKVIPQFRVQSETELQRLLEEYVGKGAEGFMLHHQDALYSTGRNGDLIKLKPYQDAEGEVVAYRYGQGKYHGQVRGYVVALEDGRRINISNGLKDKERENPLPIGTIITYQFNGYTTTGKPRFARYLRVRSEP